MNFFAFGLSDVGSVREINEDSFAISEFKENKGFAILADGMGGHNAGEVASSTAVNIIKSELEKSIDETLRERIVYNILSSVDLANKKIYDLSRSDLTKAGMGSTLVVAYISDEKLYVANIGDSRAYVINSDAITQITVDHSVVQELIERGSITPEEALVHPDKNLITRAIGTEILVNPDMFEYEINKGDKILLCSDGLIEMVRDDVILEKIKNADSLEKATTDLVLLANENGGRDNITIVLISCEE